MILDKPFPPDIRVENEVRALDAAGHELFLLAYENPESFQAADPQVGEIKVRRIPRSASSLSRQAHRLNSLNFLVRFIDPYWLREISQFVMDFRIQALHVHDLPLAGTALHVANRRGIPVVVDLHEHFPALREAWQVSQSGFKARIKRRRKGWSAYEGRAARDADHVLVVVDEAKQRLIEEHHLDEHKVSVVMNAVDLETFGKRGVEGTQWHRREGDFLISYVGGGGSIRGLETAVASLQYLKGLNPDIRLRLVGPSPHQLKDLFKQAQALGLRDRLEAWPWQPFESVPKLISVSDVCVLPLIRGPATDNTIAHKLFQYMFMAKPVIVSDCKPLQRLVRECECGLVFESGNPADLAEKISTLHGDPRLRAQLGSNGRRAVLARYNWARESPKLVAAYDELEQRKVARPARE